MTHDVKARVRKLSQDDGNYVLGWLAAAGDTSELEKALDAVDQRNAREQVPA